MLEGKMRGLLPLVIALTLAGGEGAPSVIDLRAMPPSPSSK
jgi:hypothetical protein